MQPKSIIPPLTALALAMISGKPALAAGDFNFTKIVDTNGIFSSYISLGRGLGTDGGMSGYNLQADTDYLSAKGIAISDKGGAVAYQGTLKDGNAQGIFVSTGVGGYQQIADTKERSIFSSFGQGIAVNKSGLVAFYGTRKDDGSVGLYTTSGKPGEVPKLIASNKDARFASFARGLSINDQGEVAFTARSQSGVQEVFKGTFSSNTSKITPITNCAGSAFLNQCPVVLEAPTINNKGMVAFVSNKGVFTGDGTTSNLILSNQTAFWNNSYREANINDQGFVSAFAHNNGPGQLIFKSNGSDGSIVAGNGFEQAGSNSTFLHVGSSSINNKGIVAFLANQINVGAGIFLGTDAVKDKVIGVGDTIKGADGNLLFGGAKVVDLAMDRESLSNDNEISFWAKLANGIEGIFRANKFKDSQYNPWLPNCAPAAQGTMSFCGVNRRGWYDPPTAYGFDYKMNSDSVFTSILELPSNFLNQFTVAVGDIVLGSFSGGDSVNFADYAAQLGNLLVEGLEGKGVKQFKITGMEVDPKNETAFPIKLDADTEFISFDMKALLSEIDNGTGGGRDGSDDGETQKSTPEPTSWGGLLLLIGGAGLRSSYQRRSREKSAAIAKGS